MQIIQLQYFGNINYYLNSTNSKKIIICPNLLYKKGENFNKTIVSGANGLINLSVPLLGGRNQKSKLKDVKISYDQNWRTHHLNILKSCYGNAPFFDHYYPIISKIMLNKFETMFELNLKILEQLIKCLKLNLEIEVENSNDLEIPFRNFSVDFIKSISYPQVFEERFGFIQNLSIIDLLMCLGPHSNEILTQ